MGYKLVVAVRGDLRMSIGKTAAQVAHAAVTAALGASGTETLTEWLRDGQAKVVVRVLSEEALGERLARAEATGLRATPIADAGRTELDPGVVTCAAFGPDTDAAVDEVTGDLPLF